MIEIIGPILIGFLCACAFLFGKHIARYDLQVKVWHEEILVQQTLMKAIKTYIDANGIEQSTAIKSYVKDGKLYLERA